MNTVYFQARFTLSASDPRQCPDSIAEVAFAGRSNAGKSSAINTITRSRKLARTGKTPGRTRLINHFELGEDRYLVDLPGYGYAEVSRAQQQAWHRSMLAYLVGRDALMGVVLVMDIRHPLTDSDWQMIELQQQGHSGLHALLTKADKLSKNQVARQVDSVRQQLEQAGVEATLQDFSALKKQGVEDCHTVLDDWLYGIALN